MESFVREYAVRSLLPRFNAAVAQYRVHKNDPLNVSSPHNHSAVSDATNDADSFYFIAPSEALLSSDNSDNSNSNNNFSSMNFISDAYNSSEDSSQVLMLASLAAWNTAATPSDDTSYRPLPIGEDPSAVVNGSTFNMNFDIMNFSCVNVNCSAIEEEDDSVLSSVYFKAIVYLLYVPIFIFAVLGNGTVCYIVQSTPRMRTVTNYFIANLAVGDILMSLFCVPFSFVSIFILGYWPFGTIVCHLVNYSQAVSVLVSAYTLVAISIDRYIAIMWPLRPRITKRYAKFIIAGIWGIALVTAFPILWVSKLAQPDNWHVVCNRYVCREEWPTNEGNYYYTLALFTLQFVVPLLVLIFTYTRIALNVWGKRPPGEAENTRDQRLARSKRKMIKMMVTVVIVFTICWLPFNIIVFLLTYNDSWFRNWTPLPFIWFAFHWLAMSHSCYNPVIYCFMNARFRGGFLQITYRVPGLRRCCCWRYCMRNRGDRSYDTTGTSDAFHLQRVNTCTTYISTRRKIRNNSMQMLFCILLLTLPLLGHSYPAKVDKTIALDDTDVDNEHAESGTDAQIQKRSGSFDYVAHLKGGLLSSIGHASASIASGSSGSSSGYKSIETGHHGNSVDYDPWSFKKSVLNTIFQAVKAITGGVTALKGQLIKGSGYALSASGKLVAASGDKVTDVGKSIIHSAQINTHSYGHSGGGVAVSVHPFAKFSSLSGASSGGSSGKAPGPVLHTETITTYEIPAGHVSYGPPSKPPTYSSATHQYLPPTGGTYSGGGAPFSGGHAAFEAPPNNYLPSAYGHEDSYTGHDDFNIYPRHKKLTEEEARKAASQLQEILSLLPNGKTEYTASKTVNLDLSSYPTGPGEINPEHVELNHYSLPNDLGHLEGLSHTESITAAYGPRPQTSSFQENPSDIYRQMAKKQNPEEVYIQKHPNEGYDYQPPKQADNAGYKYNNYHAGNNANNALKDLTPIIAALEVAKRRGPTQPAVNTQYSIEKNVNKLPPLPASPTAGQAPQQNFKFLPPVVQKSKYTYFDPAQNKAGTNYAPVYTNNYKVRRQVPNSQPSGNISPPVRNSPPTTHSSPQTRAQPGRKSYFPAVDYEILDPLQFNNMMSI